MSLGSYELIFATVSLLLPGYIIDVILRTRRIRKSEESQIAFFRWLVLGTIAELFWLAPAFLVLAAHWDTDQELWRYIVEHRWWFTLGWIAAVLVWPFYVGWLLAEAERVYLSYRQAELRPAWWKTPATFVGRMVTAQGPINDDSAWDTKFTNVEQRDGGQWVLVELVDGGWVAGVFGPGSDASVDPNERDLYIADVRYTSFDQRLTGLGGPGGMLIPASRIHVIHFWE